MIFEKQRFGHEPEKGIFGDCHRTAIACMLDLQPEEVPHYAGLGFTPDESWAKFEAWLRERGITQISVLYPGESSSLDDVLQTIRNINGDDVVYLLGGTSRTGVGHTVVCRGREVIHDPSPADAGIVGPMEDGWYWVTFFAHAAASRFSGEAAQAPRAPGASAAPAEAQP